jgi:hypothetical protein
MMSTPVIKKRRMALAPHQELGGCLHRCRNDLVHASVLIGNHHSRSVAHDLAKIVQQLDDLRSSLEDRVFREHGTSDTTPHDLVYVYFPGGEHITPAESHRNRA